MHNLCDTAFCYKKINILQDFLICISVPLTLFCGFCACTNNLILSLVRIQKRMILGFNHVPLFLSFYL